MKILKSPAISGCKSFAMRKNGVEAFAAAFWNKKIGACLTCTCTQINSEICISCKNNGRLTRISDKITSHSY